MIACFTLPLAVLVPFTLPQSVEGGPSNVGNVAPEATYVLRSLGLAALPLEDMGGAELPVELFRVYESAQGGTDLNGDGDALDRVLHKVDPLTGAVVNLRVAAEVTSNNQPGRSGRFLMLIYESAQGGVDLNGDGDANDAVVFLHDLATGTNTNLGLASNVGGYLSSTVAAIYVEEAAQGAVDLNGNGDANDRVLAIVDLATGTSQNLGLAIGIQRAFAYDGLVVFAVDELQHGQDVNGDGWSTGRITHVYDHAQGQVWNLGFRQGFHANAGPGSAAFLAMESGVDDHNADGDMDDMVVHVYDLASNTTNSLGLASTPLLFNANAMHANDEGLLFFVYEADSNGADFNQDGDVFDLVPFAHSWSGAPLVGANVSNFYAERFPIGDRFALVVAESWEGQSDLNGDGDAIDHLISIFDPTTGANVPTSLAIGFDGMDLLQYRQATPGTRWLPVPVLESAAGNTDLDGDGDASDAVWHVYDVQTGAVVNLGRGQEAEGRASSGDALVALSVSEQAWGSSDLNGDGDALDTCLAVWDPIHNRLIDIPMSCDRPVVRGRNVLFLASEAEQGGADLNGDGDALDLVLMHLHVP